MLTSSNTKFLYIMTSSNDLDVRFVKDIARCSLMLSVNKKVAYENQVIVLDVSKDDLVSKFPYFKDSDVIGSSDIYECMKNLECENLFIISSCHGGLGGIDAKEPIRPHQFTEAIKQNPHIKNCVALFGQCYAGIFNHLDLKCKHKNIVYIGATEMRTGLSIPLLWKSCDSDSTIWNWVANIFVFHIATWLNNPIDVDNDGYCSIIDMYKYICYKTNIQTENVEKSEAKRFLDKKITAEIGKVLPKKINNESKGEMDELDKEAVNEIDYTIPHQDCWILNAECAINMIIK